MTIESTSEQTVIDLCTNMRTWDSQLAGLPCKMHPSNLLCEVDMFPDSFVVGAPCNPFSKQSHKRFRENSVMDHQFTDLTLKRVLRLHARMAPGYCNHGDHRWFPASSALGSQDNALHVAPYKH